MFCVSAEIFPIHIFLPEELWKELVERLLGQRFRECVGRVERRLDRSNRDVSRSVPLSKSGQLRAVVPFESVLDAARRQSLGRVVVGVRHHRLVDGDSQVGENTLDERHSDHVVIEGDNLCLRRTRGGGALEC